MGYLEADGADRRQAIEQPRHPRQTYGGRPGRRHRCALDARCLITAATRILLEMMMGNRNRMPADFAGSSPPASRPPALARGLVTGSQDRLYLTFGRA